MPNIFSYGPNVGLVLGNYTGDGTVNHAITGVGGKPKYLGIFWHPVNETKAHKFEKLDLDWGVFCFYHTALTGEHGIYDDMIISLDEDGFTVSDAGQNFDPNALGKVYDFMAIV